MEHNAHVESTPQAKQAQQIERQQNLEDFDQHEDNDEQEPNLLDIWMEDANDVEPAADDELEDDA